MSETTTPLAQPMAHSVALAKVRSFLLPLIPEATLADSRELERATTARRMLDHSHEGGR